MNFLEALKKSKESDGVLWAAPILNKTSKIKWGITWKRNGWTLVPSPHGGDPATIPDPNLLFGEWYVGTPNEIMN